MKIKKIKKKKLKKSKEKIDESYREIGMKINL